MTNFEKICKGTVEELADILAGHRSCTCRNNNGNCEGNCSVILCSSYIKDWLNSPAPIELTQTEREICVGLKHLGFVFLAKDEYEELCAYKFKPEKHSGFWDVSGERRLQIETINTSFDFIKWEDDEPTSIDDLLEG